MHSWRALQEQALGLKHLHLLHQEGPTRLKRQPVHAACLERSGHKQAISVSLVSWVQQAANLLAFQNRLRHEAQLFLRWGQAHQA